MKILSEHGVLIQMHGLGIYLTGISGIGKSEIALQLMNQGAILICDDAPQLTISNKNILGSCPDGFYGLMHIHDLGIINIAELMGSHYIKPCQALDFVIELRAAKNLYSIIKEQKAEQLLRANYNQWYYQTCSVSGISLHLYPGRDITLIINTAIKQFLTTQIRFNQ